MKQIPLAKSGKFALVDDADFQFLIQFKWRAEPSRKQIYAIRSNATGEAGIQNHRSMHRLILNPELGQQVDHIDHNGLNNQRANLRLCSKRDNLRSRTLNKNNSSGYKGVSLDQHARTGRPTNKPWRVYLGYDTAGSRIYIGYFATAKEAAEAYDHATIEFYGEFAATNKSLNLLTLEPKS